VFSLQGFCYLNILSCLHEKGSRLFIKIRHLIFNRKTVKTGKILEQAQKQEKTASETAPGRLALCFFIIKELSYTYCRICSNLF